MGLFNVLQTNNTTGSSQTMLGCNVVLDVAVEFLQRYQDRLQGSNKNRIASGYPPLDVTYSIVEAEGEFQDWLPNACKCGRLPFIEAYHATNRRFF